MEKNWKALPNDSLVALFQKENPYAFEVILDRYTSFIRNRAWLATLNEEEAEDLFQDVLVHLFKKMKTKYKSDGHFSAWLRRVVGNYLCSFCRKKRPAFYSLNVAVLLGEPEDTSLSPELREQKLNDLREALQKLPGDLLLLVRLKIWEGMTYQKVSEVTGINRSTVVERLHVAYRRLKNSMMEKGYEDAEL